MVLKLIFGIRLVMDKKDETRSLLLVRACFLTFGMVAIGEIIRVYKLSDYSGIRTNPKGLVA